MEITEVALEILDLMQEPVGIRVYFKWKRLEMCVE